MTRASHIWIIGPLLSINLRVISVTGQTLFSFDPCVLRGIEDFNSALAFMHFFSDVRSVLLALRVNVIINIFRYDLS